MIRRPWFTGGVVALWALGVFGQSTVCAQHGPGRHAPGSERPAYDTKSEATFKGMVADVKSSRSALYWLVRIHTLGQGQMGAQEKKVILQTGTETVEVQLGPTAYLTEKSVDI